MGLNKKWVQVKVPASSANLGPGYDVLGIALKLYNEVELTLQPRIHTRQPSVKIEISGEGVDTLPCDERNIVWASAKKVFNTYPYPLSAHHFYLKLTNRIPLSRGLGSSAAARLAGTLIANTLCKGFLSEKKILNLTAKMEGHPDNVVPSLVGGLCVSSTSHGNVRYIRLDPPKDISAVICIPDFELSTEKARSVLPKRVLHSDAVYNVSRVTLLLAALVRRDYTYLKTAMEDKLHQNYRKKLIPGFDLVVKNGFKAGAFGISLSGSGPSFFAFAPRSKAKVIGEEMKKGFLKSGYRARNITLGFDSKGSEIRWRS